MDSSLVDIVKGTFSFPDPNDPDFQYQAYKKRELYTNKIPPKKQLVTYEDKKNYRDKACGGEKFQLYTHQALISNFFNPDTPYNGLLLFHGVGTGKTCSSSAIAEKHDILFANYKKIYIIVSGPLMREQWKNEIIEKCAVDKYLKDYNQSIGYFDPAERQKALKQAKQLFNQKIKIMSYRSLQKKTLGQKIIKKETVDGKIKKKYMTDVSGELERELAADHIDTADTLVIFDEAHNLTGNEYYDAAYKLKENSPHMKILLLSGTPMKNVGDDIIQLVNLLRPINDPIERDKVFTGYLASMDFKPNGREYLAKMLNGYVSHYRGAHPLTFAEGVEMGEVPEELLFTKVVRCYMNKFQQQMYDTVIDLKDDTLDRRSQSASNFVFPGLADDKSSLIGFIGEDGINNVRNQLKVNKHLLVKKVNEKLFDNKYSENDLQSVLVAHDKRKSIGGKILHEDNLYNFSIKFHTCLKNLNDLVNGKKGAGTAFIYSNLVKVGVELFKDILLENGYLEYIESDNQVYDVQDYTRDSITGFTFKEFKDKNMNTNDFHPATFMIFTGANDDIQEEIPEVKINILNNKFNHISNKDGKFIKFVLGSRVMNEGITLMNVREVHILDVYYNFGRVHQVIGRAIRQCVHYKITDDRNPDPKVNIYKYVVSLRKGLSAEEELYQKAERKYILVKDIERILKQVSIDCPLNYNGNIFAEEVEKYKDCITPNEYLALSEDERRGKIICPAICDFQKCTFKCYDKKLNAEYYDEENMTYRKIPKKDLDYSTFTNNLKRNEVNLIKGEIKELYKYKYVYTLDELLELIKKSYTGEKAELFDNYFLFQGLHELIPIDENDFNNFQDPIYDKYNVPGYLIHRGIYYIFQPFDQNEDVPMWYRTKYQSEMYNDLTLYNYLKNMDKFKENTGKDTDTEFIDTKLKTTDDKYDFSNMEYYDKKDEYEYVGIIDKISSKHHNIDEQTNDVFKIRPKRSKILEKKRGTGIPSLKGAVCNTSKDKSVLLKMAEKVGVKNLHKYQDDTRISICNIIRDRLLFLEKYGTKKDKNNFVYMIIPRNHPKYTFPYNLEDRYNFIIDEIQQNISFNITYDVKNIGGGQFEGTVDKSLAKYKIVLTNTKKDLDNFDQLLKLNNFNVEGNKWTLYVE